MTCHVCFLMVCFVYRLTTHMRNYKLINNNIHVGVHPENVCSSESKSFENTALESSRVKEKKKCLKKPMLERKYILNTPMGHHLGNFKNLIF